MNNEVIQAAQQVFAQPFFEKTEVRHQYKSEAPMKIALAVLASGVAYAQVNALALAVREIASMESLSPDQPISAAQKEAWKKLEAEKAVPDPLRAVLTAAAPRLEKRRDLHALSGVLAGTLEKLGSLAGVSELAAADTH